MAPALQSTSKKAGPGGNGAALGRVQELDALFERYNPLLNRLCSRWTRGHRADAQDLLADAYLRAVRATWQNDQRPDNLLAWLLGIIANLARDRLRARSRSSRQLDDESRVLETLRDPGSASEAVFATRELLSKTLAHVKTLTTMQRSALLARSAGEEYEAIAAHLGTSPANARKLVQTARSELRAQLSPHEVMLLTGSRRNSGRPQGRARSTPIEQ